MPIHFSYVYVMVDVGVIVGEFMKRNQCIYYKFLFTGTTKLSIEPI